MLKNIKYIFFDVDDTIFDFDKCAEKIMSELFKKHSLNYTPEVFPAFKRINNQFWRRIEQGEIDRKYLTAHRFETVFEHLGIDFDGPAFEKEFLCGLHDSCEEVDGAIDTVKYLSMKYPLFVASNAFYEQQINRLTLAGIIDCFNGVFVSEKVGYNKPSPDFFAKILELAHVDNHGSALMVGDSLEADIIGAKKAGMQTCWFTEKDGDEYADIIVHSIGKLKEIL